MTGVQPPHATPPAHVLASVPGAGACCVQLRAQHLQFSVAYGVVRGS